VVCTEILEGKDIVLFEKWFSVLFHVEVLTKKLIIDWTDSHACSKFVWNGFFIAK
jgi:hypothetical protein